MEKGDVAKYLPTSTVGRVEDVMERDGRVWVKLDRTGLYYAAETLTPADPKEYRATSFKERSAKKKDYRSGETVEDLNEMERNVDIDDLMPSGGGRALPATEDRGAPPSKERGAPDPETPCPLSGAGFFPSIRPSRAGRASHRRFPRPEPRLPMLAGASPRTSDAEHGEVGNGPRERGQVVLGSGLRKAVVSAYIPGSRYRRYGTLSGVEPSILQELRP